VGVKRVMMKQSITMVMGVLCMMIVPQLAMADDAKAAAMVVSASVNEECQHIGKKLGSVSVNRCLSAGLVDSSGRSVENQAILMKEYPPLLDKRKPQARILLIGGTHGDEYASISIVFNWMKILDRYHSGLFHWHVTPLLNPDGLLLSSPSVRLNSHGVDLNRNMPTPNWQQETQAYWKKKHYDPRRYPGIAPLSEPESRWLYEEIRSFKPHAIVSVHAPYGVLDFDGPPVGPSSLGDLHLKLIGVYPGSLGNSAGIQHKIPVITVELPYAGMMPSEMQQSKMWTDLIGWLRHNVPKQETLDIQDSFDDITQTLMAEGVPLKSNHAQASNQLLHKAMP